MEYIPMMAQTLPASRRRDRIYSSREKDRKARLEFCALLFWTITEKPLPLLLFFLLRRDARNNRRIAREEESRLLQQVTV